MRLTPARFLVVLAVALSVFIPVSFGQKVEWTNFKSKQGRYSVDLPGKPVAEEKDKKVTLDLGETKAIFVVWYFDLSDDELKEKKPEEVLEARMKKFTGSYKGGKIVEEKKPTLDKFPGRETTLFVKDFVSEGRVLLKGCNLWYKERMYLVGSRLYNLRWTCESESEPSAKDAEKFFKSFKLAK